MRTQKRSSILGKRKRATEQRERNHQSRAQLQSHDKNFEEGSSNNNLTKEVCTNSATVLTFGHESTKLTSSLAMASHFTGATKRQNVTSGLQLQSTAAPGNSQVSATLREVEDHLSEMMAESAQGLPEQSAPSPEHPDEVYIRALIQSGQTQHILGVSQRKLKSLRFRVKRRQIKI